MTQISGSHRFHYGEGSTWTDFLGGDYPPPKKINKNCNPQELLAPSKKGWRLAHLSEKATPSVMTPPSKLLGNSPKNSAPKKQSENQSLMVQKCFLTSNF